MPRRPIVDPRFPARLRELRRERGLSLRALAKRALSSSSHLHQFETGTATPTADTARRIDDALAARGELAAMVPDPHRHNGWARIDAVDPAVDELDAVELARRVQASDVSDETLARLEQAFDDLAVAYVASEPAGLVPRVRRHLEYVARLVDARKTLEQQRRLLVVGGWLSLLGATLHLDLRQEPAGAARLRTAAQLAEQAGHTEIRAWCVETLAWEAVTAGDYPRAVDLSRQAQTLAPRGSSAMMQATAQEGRAWARMGERTETATVLDRVARLVSTLPRPERPEHHYQYDPDKALWYTATTLAWVGDPAAEQYVRSVIRQMDAAADGVARPRRVAAARLDLSLALLASGEPEEASAETIEAISSGWVIQSNWWRVTEVLAGVARAGIREAHELRDAYETYRPSGTDT